MDLKGTAALVTGGASGLGAATAMRLASAGALVAILDRNREAAEHVASEIGGISFMCDVTNPDETQSRLTSAAAVHGPARILVNCAGLGDAARTVGRDGPISLEFFSRIVAVNLIGTFNTIRLFAAACSAIEIQAEERGVIINTASVAAFDGQIGQAAYSASKGGVVAMTLPLAREFAKNRIRVNTIAPGIFDTPLLQSAPEKVRVGLSDINPFPHRLGAPDEFAMLVEHVCLNPMLNGETIRIDAALRLGASAN
jgi:NAD(P)-dependent dehydrogenase (short-subunit alcohol dehydrogenase family)